MTLFTRYYQKSTWTDYLARQKRKQRFTLTDFGAEPRQRAMTAACHTAPTALALGRSAATENKTKSTARHAERGVASEATRTVNTADGKDGIATAGTTNGAARQGVTGRHKYGSKGGREETRTPVPAG